MTKKLKQFRFYGNETDSLTKEFFTKTGDNTLNSYLPILHLGIQTLPGTKFYINSNFNTPIIVGVTGIYELDLTGTTGLITGLRFDDDSMNIIANAPQGYLIVDIVYETEE